MGLKTLGWAMLVLLCSLGAAASAAETSGGKAPAEIQPPLSVQWICSMGANASGGKAPLAQSDRVYVTNAGALRCLDVVTGAEVWKFAPKGVRVTTAPVAWQNLIIVGADDSSVYGLNASDGKQVWQQMCAGPIGGDPIIVDEPSSAGAGETAHEELLMVGAQEMVYAMAPATGQPKWICSLSAPVAEGPVTDGSMLYFLCQDGSLESVDAAAGRYRWKAMLRIGPSAFPPVVAGRRVIVAGGKSLVAVSRSGAVSWTKEMPVGIGGRPQVVGDALYLPCVGGETGEQRPRIFGMGSLPPVSGDIVILHAQSGSLLRSAPLRVSGPATAPPLVSERVVYAGTGNALVSALDRESGSVLWTYRCLAPGQELGEAANYGVYAPIVSGGGAIYCLTGGGDLYSFSTTAPDPAGPIFSDLKPEAGGAFPGKKPLDVSFTALDQGSGVDPTSVEATLDGSPVKVEFDITSGEGTFHISSPKDGSHIVRVMAKDFRGNAGSTEWSFLTDISISPPAEKAGPTPGTARPGTTRGGAGATGGAAGGRAGPAY